MPITHEILELTKMARSGWLFNWNNEFLAANRIVYKLQLIGSDDIQGLVSLTVDQGFVFIHLVESAPLNKGREKKVFVGVGAYLFAIACKISLNHGFYSVVSFTSQI
ncbi:hypothetical protein [Paenibacillus sp. RC67]|uniref:hypothetical protein n=1 Tax=Paenibacillus sp. RC67 TaxID=3039392 RepID=UPI0024AD3046|nr:hypothetical protein [Paenibacillus sp. RC67]